MLKIIKNKKKKIINKKRRNNMEWVEIISKILNFINEVLIPLFSQILDGIGGIIQDWNVINW